MIPRCGDGGGNDGDSRPSRRTVFRQYTVRMTALLRHGERTVEDLAPALGLTDNAVRAHLATLERDGLVRQAGLRRGTSKPTYAYAPMPAAERLFPKAYGTLLRMLLDVLTERLPPSAVDDAFAQWGVAWLPVKPCRLESCATGWINRSRCWES